MHQFGWLSETRGGGLNLLQKEGNTQKGGGSLKKGGGGSTLEKIVMYWNKSRITLNLANLFPIYVYYRISYINTFI